MTVLSKSELIEAVGIEEVMEYVRTALRQGFKHVTINNVWTNHYSVEISKDDRKTPKK